MKVSYDLDGAILGKDIVCTDSIPDNAKDDFVFIQVDKDKMDRANLGAVLNPCPPFFRGEEVSQDAIASNYSSLSKHSYRYDAFQGVLSRIFFIII